jgi:hypothetical protein
MEATHAGLVDNHTWAVQTSAAILDVVDCVRTGKAISAP